MIYWQNRILSNIAVALGNKCKKVVSVRNSTDATFPTCAVTLISNTAIADDLSLDSEDDEENAVYCGIQIRIYVKTSLADAMSLMDIANKAMYKMGFRRSGGAVQLYDETNPEFFTVNARYARVIGSGDTIDKFNDD